MTRWIVAYDISDDRSRAQLAARLSRIGVRRQYSVFECRIPEGSPEMIVDLAGPYMNPGRDRLDILMQCEECLRHRRTLGPRKEVLEARYYVV
jgi:CRISPR-associated endonuclease Cas2